MGKGNHKPYQNTPPQRHAPIAVPTAEEKAQAARAEAIQFLRARIGGHWHWNEENKTFIAQFDERIVPHIQTYLHQKLVGTSNATITVTNATYLSLSAAQVATLETIGIRETTAIATQYMKLVATASKAPSQARAR